MIKGYAGRVLEIDLARREFRFDPLDEETARLYIGGKGYGTRLFYDRTRPGIDPLGPENPLIFATGPLQGSVAPQSNRFAAVCKSPLTVGRSRGRPRSLLLRRRRRRFRLAALRPDDPRAVRRKALADVSAAKRILDWTRGDRARSAAIEPAFWLQGNHRLSRKIETSIG